MGKKGKGKKGQKIVTDLDSFNQKEIKKQQEKEFQSINAGKGDGSNSAAANSGRVEV